MCDLVEGRSLRYLKAVKSEESYRGEDLKWPSKKKWETNGEERKQREWGTACGRSEARPQKT